MENLNFHPEYPTILFLKSYKKITGSDMIDIRTKTGVYLWQSQEIERQTRVRILDALTTLKNPNTSLSVLIATQPTFPIGSVLSVDSTLGSR